MRFLFVLACYLAATLALDLDKEWEAFKIQYGKNHLTSQENDARKNIFANNLKFIEKHNAEHALGLHTYTVGVNKFADLTNEEFVKQYNGLNPMAETWTSNEEIAIEYIGEVPESIDWRQKGAVTRVKDQGHCGSCWAFSAAGTMEGAHFKKTGKLVSLSEQNIIDCADYKYGNIGCFGGVPFNALRYVIENSGIDTGSSYPYLGYTQRHCHFNESNIGATIIGRTKISKGSEEDLTKAIGTIGPISVSIDASQPSFMLYHSGIYDEPQCSSETLDHGVLAVGYGTENGQDFYIVKNSWGTGWGDEGYIKMSRNVNNQCGIATNACYAVA